MSARRSPRSLAAKWARVKILLCDVDGVLTDGTVQIGDGREFKSFHIQDGLGLRLLQRAGVRVAWISNRPSPATQQRATELQIDFLHQAPGSKVKAAESILDRAGLTWEDAAFVGDDLVDLGPMQRSGLAVAVANAIEDVKGLADYVTRAAGGHGAVREVVENILRAKDKWRQLLEAHLE
jgi:3-deoxy-D-manno-octulosonate 8-phosphate phosphatase (KDO 8-P phosphatase)